MNKADVAALQGYALGLASRSRETTQYVTTKVVEKRAPTDESVKLLKEMETAARDKIIASIPLTDNALAGQMVVQREYATDQVITSVVFSLNGQRFEERVATPSGAKPDAVLTKIRDQVAARIAVEIIRANYETIRPLFMRPPGI
jgi:hypothetical protein